MVTFEDDPADGNPEFISRVVRLAENRRLEFKRVSGKMVGKALETICGLANLDGGTLVLGVADLKEFSGTARIFGVEENPEATDELFRKVRTEFDPPLGAVVVRRIPTLLHNGPSKGLHGHIYLVHVPRSGRVHSITNSGTYTRLDAGNRQLGADEITELCYRRGVRSAVSDVVPIQIERLSKEVWRRYLEGRGQLTGTFADQLLRTGLADTIKGEVFPRKAAVLLFADEPGSLLSAYETRADVRLLVYDGTTAVPGATPNLRKPPKTIRGPLVDLIANTVRAVREELAQGLTLSGSGFQTIHAYPERVVREAIVNAVVHRDYRLNRDIFIRIFDDRIEVESPGVFPGNITPKNIAKMGSRARNPLLASNLREFPERQNIDAGEGVRMMFHEMSAATLYPPQYRQTTEAAVETVTVTLLNSKRPTAWDEVSDWIDRVGFIANADVVRIAKVDTLRASKMLGTWRDQGLVVQLPGKGKRNMAYTKASQLDSTSLLAELEDNNGVGA